MTAPNDKLNQTIAGMSRETIAAKMEAGGVDPEEAKQRATEKAHRTKVWLGWAAVFVVVTLVVVAVGLYLVVKVTMETHNFPLIVAIIFAVASGIPLLVAVYCATQADGEFFRIFLGNLFRIGRAVRGKDDSPSP